MSAENINTAEAYVNSTGGEVVPFPTFEEEPPKYELYLKGGELDTLADKAMNILVKLKVDIFQRGHKLVRPIISKGADSQGKPTRFPILIEIDLTYMRRMLCRHISWMAPDNRLKGDKDEKFKRVNVPEDIAKAIMANAGHWTFRTISGVISTPTLRYDGSILSKQGYDPATHLYLESDIVLPYIPERPTKAEAEKELELLEDLLREFPFVPGASKSVALSAILSALARSMFSVVPAHGARAPTPGTGKSYLFDIVAMILLGEMCPVISVSFNAEETEKRIVGSAISGQQIINLDNVNGRLEGDALCQLIERPVCNLRVLGRSAPVRVENSSIVFFNGNNCRVANDMTRRAIIAELDARMENPAEREFEEDPVAKVRADRGKYIAACMIILRAYIAANKPDQKLTPMNSFGEWSATVRSALVWLGRKDPCETIAKAREEDPVLQKLAAFIMAAKSHAYGKHNAKSTAKLIALSNETKSDGGYVPSYVPSYPELHEFMQEFIGRGGKPDPTKVGIWLKTFKGRPVGDDMDGRHVSLRIASTTNTHRKSEDWFIEAVSPGMTQEPTEVDEYGCSD